MAKYDRVGGGKYDVYKKRKDNPVPAIIFGIFIILMLFGAVQG